MKRLALLALVVSLSLTGVAHAATYGYVQGNLSFTGLNVGAYVGDYDMQIVSTTNITHDISALNGSWFEVFCLEGVNASTTTSRYNVVDLSDIDTVDGTYWNGMLKTTAIRKLASAAQAISSRAAYTSPSAGITSKFADITVWQSTNDAVKGTNQVVAPSSNPPVFDVEVTVAGLQAAIWDVIGVNYGASIPDYIATARNWLKSEVVADYNGSNNLYAEASIYGFEFVDPNDPKANAQDYGFMIPGGVFFDPVPEPTSLVALCGLAVMFGGATYRRRRNGK